MRVSKEIKDRIDKLSYNQKLEVEYDLEFLKWNNLLGNKPKNQNFNSFQNYIYSIRKYLNKFIFDRDRLRYWHVIKQENMTEEEFKLFWINRRMDILEKRIL